MRQMWLVQTQRSQSGFLPGSEESKAKKKNLWGYEYLLEQPQSSLERKGWVEINYDVADEDISQESFMNFFFYSLIHVKDKSHL